MEAALKRLRLVSDRRIEELSPEESQAFRLLVGWEPGGPVVEYPTGPEAEARQRRERWKETRAGKGREEPCLLVREENIEIFRANARRDPATARWPARTGGRAAQLYVNGDDGRSGHRHADPLDLILFAGGRELFPDLGYLADHPANAWVRSTAAHNTVAVDGGSVAATGRGVLQGWEVGEGWRFCDLRVAAALQPKGQVLDLYRRAVLALALPGEGLVLIDIFDVEGGELHDYLIRVNDPERCFRVPDLEFEARTEALFQDAAAGPRDFRMAGATCAPFVATWGEEFQVSAHVLTSCDEVFCFRSPAWRNVQEIFEDPQRNWDSLGLRHMGGSSRFVVVYEVAPQGERLLVRAKIAQLHPVPVLMLMSEVSAWEKVFKRAD